MTTLRQRISQGGHWLWLLPLAVGAAAFAWPVEKSPVAKALPSSREDRQAAARRSDGAAVLADVHALLEERRQKASDEEDDRLDHLSGAERRARLLELKVALTGMKKRGEQICYCGGCVPEETEASTLTEALTKEKDLAGLHWLEENWPERLQDAVGSLAARDPAAAFDYLVTVQRMNPCSTETAMKLLATQAENGGAAALLDGVKRMPWQLFDDGFSSFKLPEDLDPALWVSSGASAYLHGEGIEVKGLIPLLAPVAPVLVVQEWLANPKGELDEVDAYELVDAMRQNPESEPAMLDAFRNAGPDALDTLRDGLRRRFLDDGGNSGYSPDDEGLARWRAELFLGENWKPRNRYRETEEQGEEPATEQEDEPDADQGGEQ